MEPTPTNLSHILIVLALTLAGLALIATPAPAPAQQANAAANANLRIAALRSPAGANSSEPQFSVQGNRVLLSWLEGDEDHPVLKFAERTAAGWTPTQTIHASDQINANSADVPSVQLLASGTLAAQWTDKVNGPNPEASTVRLAFSTNQGRTWSAPVSPHHDGTQTEHGFVSLFQAPGAGNGLGMVWLDGRDTTAKAPNDNTGLRASIHDAAGKQLKETVIDPRVCDCCTTSSAPTSEGVIVAYRDRSAAEIRDIYVTAFNGTAWSAPVLVHKDDWKINGCPVNGPAVTANGRDVAVAWFTGKDDKGQAFVAFSHDAGHTFGPAVRIDDARSLGHVGVRLLADGSAVVSWVELAESSAQFRARKVNFGRCSLTLCQRRRKGRSGHQFPAHRRQRHRTAVRLDGNRRERHDACPRRPRASGGKLAQGSSDGLLLVGQIPVWSYGSFRRPYRGCRRLLRCHTRSWRPPPSAFAMPPRVGR